MFEEIDKQEKPNNKSVAVPEQELSEDVQLEKEPKVNEQKNKIEDIFSDGEDDLDIEGAEPFYNEGKEKPETFKPIEKDKGAPETELSTGERGVFKKILAYSLFIISFCVIAFGGYFVYGKYVKGKVFSNNEPEVSEVFTQTEENKEPVSQNENNADEEASSENIDTPKPQNTSYTGKDTDGDGLSDQEEIELGLNITNIDTDSDGLFDREEVYVYMTSPKNSDTDGDGFSDGDEVDAGYNPNGPGKLYDINNEINGQ